MITETEAVMEDIRVEYCERTTQGSSSGCCGLSNRAEESTSLEYGNTTRANDWYKYELFTPELRIAMGRRLSLANLKPMAASRGLRTSI